MQYQLKQNPAPNEWTVLILKPVHNRHEILNTVTFKGENALGYAQWYYNTMIMLEAKEIEIKVLPGKGITFANLKHI